MKQTFLRILGALSNRGISGACNFSCHKYSQERETLKRKIRKLEMEEIILKNVFAIRLGSLPLLERNWAHIKNLVFSEL